MTSAHHINTEQISRHHFPNLHPHPCLWWAIHSDEVDTLKGSSQKRLHNVLEAYRDEHPANPDFVLITLCSQGSKRTVPGSSEPNRPSVQERSDFIREDLSAALSESDLSVVAVHQGADGSRSSSFSPSFLKVSGPTDKSLPHLAELAHGSNYRLDIFLTQRNREGETERPKTESREFPHRKINAEEFNDYAIELARNRSLLTTIGERANFRLSVTDNGHEYTPESTSKARSHNWKFVERVLDKYNQTFSFITSDYTFTVNGTYQLAIIRDLIQTNHVSDHVSGTERVVPTQALDLLTVSGKPSQSSAGASSGTRYSKKAKYVGDTGEELALRYFKDRSDSERWTKVRWIAYEGGKPGWDIQFMDESGSIVAVEVKSTVSDRFSYFELTENEWNQAKKLGDHYWLALVAKVLTGDPKIQILENPISVVESGQAEINPTRYRFSLLPDSLS